jgi:hypothetical protein
MEMKKIIAAVLALWLGLCSVPAYAGIGDAFDLAGAAVSSMFSEDVDQTTNDILQRMEKDSSQKKILREHIQKTEGLEHTIENAAGHALFLQKIPLVGGIFSRIYFGLVTAYCEYRASDDSHEIVVKFEDMRSDLWDVYGDILQLVRDVDPESTLSMMNFAQQANRGQELDKALKKIKEAALRDDAPAASSQSDAKSAAPPAKDAAVEKYRSLARQCGLDGEVVAMSRGTGDGSGVCLLRAADRSERYLIYNAADGMKAVVPADISVNQIKSNRDGQYSLTLWLDIYDAPRSHDAAAGVWKGTMHRMPILVKYEVKNGEVIPGMITTANGTESSANCTEVLYETRNVTTINLLLTEIRSLR